MKGVCMINLNTLEKTKMILNSEEYRYFKSRYSAGDFNNISFGQAFYNHFKLKMIDQKRFQKLCDIENNQEAIKIINELFEFK